MKNTLYVNPMSTNALRPLIIPLNSEKSLKLTGFLFLLEGQESGLNQA